jgi:hypothetical protein
MEGVKEMPHRANLVARILLSVIVISLLSGCLYRPGAIAPSNIPLEGRSYRMVGETAATDSAIRLFGILPVSGSNTTRQAMDAAIRKRSGDALIDITVEHYTQYWILFSRHVTAVRGLAIQFE